ncbi:aminotransferase-like domain-containing protein [Aneurinibacillus sp. REN35]|uniref:aminotransferase-like domain-containing protein n=1 Tax=Aneurinibacillus sp. REN35 TaxID=3237286 RepID=UPI003527652A
MRSDEWRPNLNEGTPIYRQIVAYIKEKIAQGEWPIGFRIPAERTLAKQLGVNRSTVTTAFAELAAEGLIEGKRGSGTHVVNNTWTLLAAAHPPDWRTYVESGVHRPNLSMIQRINREEFTSGIIRLGTGEIAPDLFPAETMRKIMVRAGESINSLGYEEPQGLYALREEISRHVASYGITASPSSILIVSGVLQALHLISIGLLPQGSSILLEKPSYLHSVRVFQSAGIKLCDMEALPCAKDIPALIAHSKRKTAASLLYTIPSFHNPTGRVLGEEARKCLLDVCGQERLPIVEDDVYGELWLDKRPPAPLKAHDKHGLVLYMGSLSKTLSPGLRIGWLIGPEPVIQRLADIKMQTDYGSSSLSQWTAREWLASGLYTEHVAQIRQKLRERREVAVEMLSTYMSGLAEWHVPAGGFYIWLRLLPELSLSALFDEALSHGILLNPGTIYHPDARSYLRLSYAYASSEEMEEGIRRLALLVKKASEG